jgi:hypothetical protein
LFLSILDKIEKVPANVGDTAQLKVFETATTARNERFEVLTAFLREETPSSSLDWCHTTTKLLSKFLRYSAITMLIP